MKENSGSSIFSQILNLFSRVEFNSYVKKYGNDKHSKGFSSWDHFVSMLFCQLGSAKSLREICFGLKSCMNKSIHLGLMRIPTKSTLSYANKHRSFELYESLFYDLLTTFQKENLSKKNKFKFKNKLYNLDVSIIDLCMEMFDWAKYKTTKGAVKLYLLLDHEGYLLSYINITDGKTHEINIARIMKLPTNSIVAMDKAYNDYGLSHDWSLQKIWFVTRQKENALFDIVEELKPPKNRNIISDQVIKFTSSKAKKECPIELRRVIFYHKAKDKTYTFLTNNFKLGASTIANIYKDRWEIELFFKLIKQNLKIKTFVGTTANAVKIQLWTALISILLIKYLKFKSTFSWSLSNMIALLRWNLMVYKDLRSWIQNPFYKPSDYKVIQPTLF